MASYLNVAITHGGLRRIPGLAYKKDCIVGSRNFFIIHPESNSFIQRKNDIAINNHKHNKQGYMHTF